MATFRKLRLGTRGSKLALAQAHSISALLRESWPGLELDIVTVKTSGDRGERDRLGAFVHEIQQSLLDDGVDIALHCLKDLPTESVPGLKLSAYLQREDPRDTLISRGPTLDELPSGSVVGTGSVRRTSQIAALHPHLKFKPLVGNIDTRMRKLMAGDYDAIILAIAGLRRLGLLDGWAETDYRELTVHPLEPSTMLPAPGQAVLVLETRSTDTEAVKVARALHDPMTQVCADAERQFLKGFGGGCSVPVASLATLENGTISLTGLVASPDGRRVLRDTRTGPVAEALDLACQMTQELGDKGAFELFEADPRMLGGAGH